jgi:hypothetical protein
MPCLPLSTVARHRTNMNIYLPIAELSLNAPMLLGLGLSVGLLSGLFGIGGGFILTPVLIFLGVPPAVAVGTGTSQVVASSVSGAVTHWQRANVDLELGLLLILGGLAGASTGVAVQRLLQRIGQLDTFIAVTYVVMLSTIGTLMLIESINVMRRQSTVARRPMRRGGQHTWVQRLPLKRRFPRSKLYISTIPPVLIGAFAGWLTAIMGVGGGFLLVPAMIYMLRVPTRLAIGTSTFQIVFITAFTTVMQSWSNHAVDVMLALPLMAGGVIGAQYGVRIAHHLPAEQLRILLAVLVLAVAARMAADLAIEPAERYIVETLRR